MWGDTGFSNYFFVWHIIILGTVTLYRTFFAKICCKILARETIIEKIKAETQHRKLNRDKDEITEVK